MQFKVCRSCRTHFVSPRPTTEALRSFYETSEACRYWRSQTLNLPDEQLYHIYGPRVHWIAGLVDEFIAAEPAILDVQTKYPHLLKHLIDEKVSVSINVFEPLLFERQELLPVGVNIMKSLDTIRGKVNIVTAFDTLERVVEPKRFFRLAAEVCQPGGLLLVTTASCSGFEYQILGEYAPNINPINRMNLFTIEALKKNIESAGFQLIELSTPGRLDVEIVRQALEDYKDAKVDPFWRYFFDFRDKHAQQDLQKFLQVNLLSSHVRIAAQKKG